MCVYHPPILTGCQTEFMWLFSQQIIANERGTTQKQNNLSRAI